MSKTRENATKAYGFKEKVSTVRKVIAVLHEGKQPVMRSISSGSGKSLSPAERKLLNEAKKSQVPFDPEELPLLKEAFERFDIPKSDAVQTFLGIPADHKPGITVGGDPLTVGIALVMHLSGESVHYSSLEDIEYSAAKFHAICMEKPDSSSLQTLERALAFLVIHADHKAQQPVHDLALFETPSTGSWTPSLWYEGVMSEKKLLKYLPRADVVEKHLERDTYPELKKKEDALLGQKATYSRVLSIAKKEKDQKGITSLEKKIAGLELQIKEARTLAAHHEISVPNAVRILAEHGYSHAKLIDGLILPEYKKQALRDYTFLALEHGVQEVAYNKGFKILADPNLKTEDRIPDISIDGADLGEEFKDYYMVKLQPGDYRGLLLGKLTNCCQSIGEHSTACVEDGMSNPNSGFVAIFKKSKSGVMDPINDRMLAQSYAWFGKDEFTKNHLVFDSWERLGVDNNRLLFVFYGPYSEKAMREYGVEKVTLGTGGNTPENISFEDTPTPGSLYGDSRNQFALGNKAYPELYTYLAAPFLPLERKLNAFDVLAKNTSGSDSTVPLEDYLSNALGLVLWHLVRADSAEDVAHFLKTDHAKRLKAEGRYGFGGALCEACNNKNSDIVKALLDSNMLKNISVDGEYGIRRALSWASGNRVNPNVLSAFLASDLVRKIPVKGRDGWGGALSWLCKHGDADLLKALLASELGKTIPIDGEYGVGAALDEACNNSTNEDFIKTFLDSELVNEISLEGEYSVGAALQSACRNRNVNVLNAFLASNLAKTIPQDGEYGLGNALRVACMYGTVDALKAFLASELAKEIPLVGKYSVGSALQSLCDNKRVDMVEVLLSSDCAKTISDKALFDSIDGIMTMASALADTHLLKNTIPMYLVSLLGSKAKPLMYSWGEYLEPDTSRNGLYYDAERRRLILFKDGQAESQRDIRTILREEAQLNAFKARIATKAEARALPSARMSAPYGEEIGARDKDLARLR